MAMILNPSDAHVLINAVAQELFGKNTTIQAVDTSSFVSVGESIMAQDHTNVLNALSHVLGRTLNAVRPYNGKFKIIQEIDAGLFGSRWRKISFYADDALSAGFVNTQLNGKNLGAGLENTSTGTLDSGANSGTGSMWEQHPKTPVEFFFGGSEVWQYCITRYETQLAQAFRSEADFIEFWSAVITAANNDIEMEKEAFRRSVVLNYMAGIYDLSASMPNSAKNLTKLFNDKFGTSYTSAQLKTTYLESFLKFLVATIKEDSARMEAYDLNYHWNPGAGASKYLLRHTPKADQRLFLYRPLIAEAEAWVYPSLFNPEWLDINGYEPVETWQNLYNPMSIKVTPAIPNVSTPTAQTSGSTVTTDVVGVLFDKDACMAAFIWDSAYTTGIESRKHYYNTWHSFQKQSINDFTEKGILYYMEDSNESKGGDDGVKVEYNVEIPEEVEPVETKSTRKK